MGNDEGLLGVSAYWCYWKEEGPTLSRSNNLLTHTLHADREKALSRED